MHAPSLALRTSEPRRSPQPTARASALTHLAFERPDLDRAASFLLDFGLTLHASSPEVLHARGAAALSTCYRVERGPSARFLGLGFAVDTRDELVALAALPGASAIEPCPDPGGGARVILHDPSGFRLEISHGRAPQPALPMRAPLALNTPTVSPRVDHGQRLEVAPPQVVRLGHCVLEVADFQATCAFYTQHLGLIPSDVQVLPDGDPAVVFMRLDRGDRPTDHHTLAIAQGIMPAFSHCAFELVDADAIGMGQRILRERGHTHAWGIGRHLLGSQIFDYWEDPWGDKHEHYCDGDVFTSEVPMGVHAVSREAMSQWGPPMPASFTRPRPSLAMLRGLTHSLRNSPDVTLDKVRTLARLFG